MRLALLTEIPAPYRVPLFNALADTDGVDLRVLFLAARDPRRDYRIYEDEHRFEERILPGRELRRGNRWMVLNRGVGRELRSFRPDVVIVGGWNQPAFWQALAWTRLRRRPFVTWVESTARDERPGAFVLEFAKRALARASAGFLVPGRASAEYLESLGVERARIAVAPNAVDAKVFERGAATRRAGARPTLLYAGRLDREKGLEGLLEAVRGLEADVVLVGKGSEEERLRSRAPANVRFADWVERDELVGFYAEADAFVLPSLSEQWGMVLNEAALAGLPIVATDAAGAAHELIDDGVNGFRVPAGDVEALRDALRRVVDDSSFRERAGARSREIVAHLTPEAWAAGVVGLVRRL